ncbi:MAG: DUF4468 domain-containing protein [Thermoanaerobaculia bacterium]
MLGVLLLLVQTATTPTAAPTPTPEAPLQEQPGAVASPVPKESTIPEGKTIPTLAPSSQTNPPALKAEQVEPLSFPEVVKVEGATASELYNRGHVWFAKAFRSANNVLQLQDKETATLVGKGGFTYEPNVFIGHLCIGRTVHFTITLIAKDGRYKYTVTDFIHEGPLPAACVAGAYVIGVLTTAEDMPDIGRGTSKSWRAKVWKHLKQRAKEETDTLVRSLKESMQKPAQGGDDW